MAAASRLLGCACRRTRQPFLMEKKTHPWEHTRVRTRARARARARTPCRYGYHSQGIASRLQPRAPPLYLGGYVHALPQRGWTPRSIEGLSEHPPLLGTVYYVFSFG